ncbi:MAG: nucleoside phosphorylase [Bacillota bacterium]|nr:nucleoside phosphorylase [Bacillota bacterium]
MKDFPILEFDEDRNSFIKPQNIVERQDIAECCVLCFFAEAIETILSEYEHRIITYFHTESFNPPVYELTFKRKKVVLIQAGVGAPTAAGQIEDLVALGCKKFIVCGSCGVLEKEIAVEHLIIPTSAVRDEGTSYHYVAPSREMIADNLALQSIENILNLNFVPYIKAKTWTTDAFYRETIGKIKQRKSEGCVTVEMEASAYMAVAQYLGVTLGQILYAGDNLGGDIWDSREFTKRSEVREFVLRLALDSALAL